MFATDTTRRASYDERVTEAITREQAVAAYTRGSAFAEFAEGEKGTIAAGRLADIVVLSKDIFVVPGAELPDTESLLTMVGGRIVLQGTSIVESSRTR
jgi:predicted amidohydrolase YtcJ